MSAGEALLRGAVIGFAIAAPVGPIGLLCIRRTLAQGPAAGIATGLGAAAADAAYGLAVALGLGAVAALLVQATAPLQVAGGVLLAWLGAAGLRQALRRPGAGAAAVTNGAAASGAVLGMGGAFASGFALTLANPATILSFVAVVAGLGGAASGAGLPLVAGVFLGSVAWWLLLVGGVGLARRALPAAALRAVEIGSGLCLLGFGVGAIAMGAGLA